MKKIIPIVAFCLICAVGFLRLNDIFVEKYINRCYMLAEHLETIEDIDVQVFGSCHAYTSFNSLYFEEKYDISSYNMAFPSEILPVTYMRMYERFKVDTPKVALVEIWGINAYETYIPTEQLLDDYMRPNVENLPFSLEKLELIEDFETLDPLEDNFAVLKYKDRLLDFSLNELDFDYSFEKANEMYNADGSDYYYNEMLLRFANNGYKPYEANPLTEYERIQGYVYPFDKLEPEEIIQKYLEKIIALCEENNVTLIFYRAPYLSTENELRKANWMEEYLGAKGITFYDVEEALEWDYDSDFIDYEHLSINGAYKVTDYLGEIIVNEMNK